MFRGLKLGAKRIDPDVMIFDDVDGYKLELVQSLITLLERQIQATEPHGSKANL